MGLALTVALLLGVGLYWSTEPSRQKGMADEYKLATAEIFVQNCFYCHGRQGTGGIGPSLRATKLDEEGLKKTISRGVIIMPTWAREEGGTLTSFQVQGLAAFILNWDEKLVEDAFVLHPIPATPNPPPRGIPPPYAGMKSPFPWGEKKTVEMGQVLYELMCTSCHWPVRTQPPSFNWMSAVFSRDLEEHPDFYFWTISEGRPPPRNWRYLPGAMMPPFKARLPEKQRWQILNYLWSVGKEYEKNAMR
ncbi:MAG: c-type cytochrome [Chloroflexi bacterium]|nr:c-type cytochrome [Chloroflexota bacterium]